MNRESVSKRVNILGKEQMAYGWRKVVMMLELGREKVKEHFLHLMRNETHLSSPLHGVLWNLQKFQNFFSDRL